MAKKLHFVRESSYQKLSPPFLEVIDNYKMAASKTEKRVTTIQSEANNGAAFLLCLQNQGAKCLADVTDVMVQNFFFDGEKQLRGESYKCNITAVLKGNKAFGIGIECKRICNLLPPIRRARKNYPYLQKSESETIKQELLSGTKLSTRDKAILTLLMHTGIRGVDIAKMSTASIDWRADRINIVQSKTEVPLSLPLSATVGNAIYDYIKEERQNELGLDNLFQNQADNNKSLRTSSIGAIVTRALHKIGIRTNGGQTGVRLFRHNLATSLLESGVVTKVITEILGHTSPLSLNPYIDADIGHLRECGLDISDFPIRKEVFD